MKRRVLLLCSIVSLTAHADGVAIDKIYHPYVDALEQELEYRSFLPEQQVGALNPPRLHQLSLGTAMGSRVFAEVYAVASRPPSGALRMSAWEAEIKWQLTEQGEYLADFGLLLEYEHGHNADSQEFTMALLVEKEWGKWSGTANLHLIREWGADITGEVETALATQLRYRYSRLLEPALEFYAGQHTRGAGPVLQGTFNTGVRRNVHWEAGLIFGLDATTPDRTWRLLIEHEF